MISSIRLIIIFFSHLMALGDCRNNSEDIFACDYTKDDGLYFFDWAKLQWINHQGKVLSFQIIKTKLFRRLKN